MYTLLRVIWRVLCVFWMALRYAVAGLMLAAAVVAIPYVVAMIILWLRAHL